MKGYWEYNKTLEETIDLLRTKAEFEKKEAEKHRTNPSLCDIDMSNMSYYLTIAQWLEELKELKNPTS